VTETRILIVGSGFGGLGAALRLKQRGIHDFLLLERAADLGGTWRDNTYPGCACDVESHLYSFSFAQNPDWSQWYSGQPEIRAYLQRCARDGGAMPHIRFEHDVQGARWDDSTRRWRVETSNGTFVAQFLVLATGPLSEPVLPVLPGLARFEGKTFHSARWDHTYDLTGKQVAVIGTGASAIQFVPEIQPRVAKLHLFQRTPPWVIPRLGHTIPRWQRTLFRRVPPLQRFARFCIYLYRELSLPLFRHPAAMRLAQAIARRHIRKAIADPVLRRKLTPDYTIGCKRILLSNDYYPALAQTNVEVVTSGIAEVRARSIVDGDGVERLVDALIFGTGFRPTEPPLATAIISRDGRTLAELWTGSPKAHLGTTVAGMPNFFILLGPNTGLGHTSVVFMTEGQIEHLLSAIAYMHENRIDVIEPRAEAQQQYVEAVDRRMRGTVWVAGGCASWYLDRTGRNSTLWPDFTWRFRKRVDRFKAEEYVTTHA
jgi:cation diffusion facilitator CzcD-associated flavoprotein CzcO